MYIYMFWCHEEHGPQELKATTDREKVVDLAKSYDVDGWFERSNFNPDEAMEKLLAHSDETLADGEGIHSLMSGWGGLHLQVVEES